MLKTSLHKGKTNTKLHDLIDYYAVCNRCANKSQRTINWYTDNLNQFLNYLKSHHISDAVDDIDIKILRQYVIYLMNRDKFKNGKGTLAPLSVHGHVRTLRAFFNWAGEGIRRSQNSMPKYKRLNS